MTRNWTTGMAWIGTVARSRLPGVPNPDSWNCDVVFKSRFWIWSTERQRTWLSCCSGIFFLVACDDDSRSSAVGPSSQSGTAITDDGQWIGVWSTAMMGPYPLGPFTSGLPGGFSDPQNPQAFPDERANAQTFRMLIRPTRGGDDVRACFSNLLGDRPLILENAKVAMAAGGPAIVPGSSVDLRFDESNSVSIPAGEKRCSDSAAFAFDTGSDVAVSVFLPGQSGPMTWHAEAFATQYVNGPNAGDDTGDETGAPFGDNVQRSWFFLTEFDVARSSEEEFSITALGDSITDGDFSTPGTNTRYPDLLAGRLQSAGTPGGVRNMGLNGNRITGGSTGGAPGASAINRFLRDAVGAGSSSVFVLLGINDLGAGVSAETVFDGLRELARQARLENLCIVVSTVLPRNDPQVLFGWDPVVHEPERQALNALLMGSNEFDFVADIASAMADPIDPNRPNSALFSDGVHPNSAGMQVLADAIPLDPLTPSPMGSCDRAR